MNKPCADVIGAGPAGLSAAIGLTRAGYRVNVTEQRLRWTGRVCGCFLSPEASRHLQWLDVLRDVEAVAVPVSVGVHVRVSVGVHVEVPVGDAENVGLAEGV